MGVTMNIKVAFLLFLGLFGGTQTLIWAEDKPLNQGDNPPDSRKILPFTFQSEFTLAEAPQLRLSTLDIKKLEKEDVQREIMGGPYRFAMPHQATEKNYTKTGSWVEKDGIAIWRLEIVAKGSKSLNLGFNNVFLPHGSRLFLYSRDRSQLIGPFTDKDNKAHKQLWTPIIQADNVTIEINVPIKMKPYLRFELKQINQGYRGISSDDINKSGSCNNDVVCTVADQWRDEIRSVARYTITSPAGTFLCTGTLVNNVAGDRTPYFLTAQHCGPSQATSPSMVFYWNYETTVCAGTPDGQLNQFQTGAIFRSSLQSSDFALVELDSTPDASFNTYWAGWDNRDIAPPSAVGVHHPAGDEKRISFDDDPLTITPNGSDATTVNGTHLRIGAWDDGTTEGGSSGSAIWNSSHHIVGTLTGGLASCSAPDSPDWYGRMAKHWLGDGTSQGQVKTWLDSGDSGAQTLNGINGCQAPDAVISLNSNSVLIGDTVNFSVNATGGQAPYTYAWDFNLDGQIDSTEQSPDFIYTFLFQNNVNVKVTDVTGCGRTVSSALVVSNQGGELFLANGQIPTGWVMATGANANWEVVSTPVFEGSFSLKSGSIGDSQNSAIEVSADFTGQNNFIGFVVKTTTETGFDFLKFFIDGVLISTWSGEIDWHTVSFPIEVGTHTLRWSYEKDGNTIGGSDTVWIDGVTGFSMNNINQAPVANVAQTSINATVGDTVLLDASDSTDPDGDTLTFLWEQTSGASVSLTNAGTDQASFVAPDVNAPTVFAFKVTTTDPEGLSDSENVSVTVAPFVNIAPVANVLNSTISVAEGNAVTLDASNSTDVDGDNLSFVWTQTSGDQVTLTNENNAQASFTAPEVSNSTTLVFEVTVADFSGASDTATVTVTVTDIAVPPPPSSPSSGGGGGGGSVGLSLLGLLLLRRQFKKCE